MFLDARTVARGDNLSADVCIVGAGAAGLALAHRLADTGLTTLIIESGGLRAIPETQDLNQGTSNQSDYPFLASRARVFGGTTTRWTGACIALDRTDFAPRPWLPHSGWPIKMEDLAPFYAEAAEFFGLPASNDHEKQLSQTPFHGGALVSKTVWYSTPIDLGRKYRRMIEQSRTMTCLLNGSATQLHPCSSGQSIDTLTIQCVTGNHFTVKARASVIATGGIENARLLLASNDAQPRGIGNQYDTVGRYHMEHPIRAVGILPVGALGKGALPFTNRVRIDGAQAQGTFGLSSEVRTQQHLLDMHVRLYRYHRLEDKPSVIAAKSALAQRGEDGGHQDLKALWRSHRVGVAKEVLAYATWHYWNKMNRSARFDHLRLTAFVEQEPDADNRITLSSRKGAFGVPLPHLHHRESTMMKDSMQRSLGLMRDAFRANGLGDFRYDTASTDHLAHYNMYGLHQMGSTRMSVNPRDGVVDRDCKVHGMANLFIAGSSVFPTGGAANPTLTIAALALRLSAHLCSVIRTF